MIAAAYWAGYLATHPAWPLIFAACCAAAAVYVWCMRAEDKRDDRAAGLPQAPRRGTRFRAGALTALARGTSWGRRAIALRIHGITVDVTGDRAPAEEPVAHYSPAATERSLTGDIHGTLACGAYHWGLVTDDPALVTCGACKCALEFESTEAEEAYMTEHHPAALLTVGPPEHPETPPATRLATGAERDAAAPWYAPELAPRAELSPWEHQTMWFTLGAIDADIQARGAAGGDA